MSVWSKLRKVKAEDAPRLLIYGPPKMGKTTLASEFPGAIFLQVEDGTPGGNELNSFGKLDSFAEVMQALGSLYTETHEFKTIVIDSLDKLEPMVWAALCAEKKWESIETPGYGKGYTEADNLWRDLVSGLNALRTDLGMTIIVICHSEIERFDDPSTASYSQYQLRLHKRARAIFSDEVDAILLVKQDVAIKQEEQGFNKTRAVAEGINRFIFCEARPAFLAGNRYGLPAKIRFDKGKGYAALAPFLPTHEAKQEK